MIKMCQLFRSFPNSANYARDLLYYSQKWNYFSFNVTLCNALGFPCGK